MTVPDRGSPLHPSTARGAVLLAGGLAASLFHAGCAVAPAPGPGAVLRGAFPAQAARILEDGEALGESAAGYELGPGGADGVAALSRRVSVVLPRLAEEAFQVGLPGGFQASVREHGAAGEARLDERSVTYQRAGGTAFWTATAAGFEEWLHLRAGAAEDGHALASWTVTGARLWQVRDVILLLDEGGVPRVRVTAPVAYTARGRALPVRLRAAGDRIDLFVDGAAGEELLVDPAWTAASALGAPRERHTATPLPGGRVLVAGGHDGATALSSAELYDPRLDAWLPAAPLGTARQQHVAVALRDGRVLVAGGNGGLSPTSGAEIYDPRSDAWTPAASMAHARQQAAAVLLPNPSREVLVTGGFDGTGYLTLTERYDPDADQWAPAAGMPVPRAAHTLTVLADDRVLVAGGRSSNAMIAAAEVYDPTTGAWASAGAMSSARFFHTATRMGDGRVLVAGGTAGPTLATAELFDPASGSWSATGSMAVPRSGHTATRTGTGKVLIAGGVYPVLTAAEEFDPATSAWTAVPSMRTARQDHTATLLGNGKVLLAGGHDGSGVTASAERYVPITLTCIAVGAAQDTAIAAAKPTKNYGASGTMATGLVVGGAQQALVQFDVSAIPPRSTVTSARLRLQAFSVSGAPAPVRVHRATAAWAQASATWGSFNGASSPAVEGQLPAASSGATAAVDLTPLVQAFVDGTVVNDGLLLERDLSGTTAYFTSEYNVASGRPRLDVCYVAPGAPEWQKTWPAGATIADIKTDAVGNVMVAGLLTGTADFGGGVQLTATSPTDAYVVTLDAAGSVVGGHLAVLPGPAVPSWYGARMTLNTRGELLLAAGFELARFDRRGNVVWQSSIGGTWGDFAIEALALSDDGVWGVGGYLYNSVSVMGISVSSENAFSFRSDGFYLSPAGARAFGTDGYSSVEALAIDASGSLYVAGLSQTPTDFGDGTPISDFFVAAPGLWASTGPLVGLDFYPIPGANAENLAFDGSGNLVAGSSPYSNIGSVYKYDRAGNVLWTRLPLLDWNDPAYLYIDGGGVAGDALDDTVIAGVGNGTGVALGKYDPAGNPLWSTGLGFAPSSSQYTMSVPATDAAGHTVVAWSYTTTTLARFAP